MNVRAWIDKQSNGSPTGRPGVCRRTRALHGASETRAPPTAGATTTISTVITVARNDYMKR